MDAVENAYRNAQKECADFLLTIQEQLHNHTYMIPEGNRGANWSDVESILYVLQSLQQISDFLASKGN